MVVVGLEFVYLFLCIDLHFLSVMRHCAFFEVVCAVLGVMNAFFIRL